MNITTSLIVALLQARMESDVADDVLAVLKLHEGKPLTFRILPLLPGGTERWRINYTFNTTKLEEREYTRSSGGRGTSLLLAYATKNVTIDTAFIVDRNPADFAGRIERNKNRRAAITFLRPQ